MEVMMSVISTTTPLGDALRTSSSVTPGVSSTSWSPAGVTSMTARSVIIRCTTALPVYGSEHSLTTCTRRSSTGAHEDDHPLGAVDEIQRTTHPLDHRAGDCPVREVAVRTDLNGAQDRRVDLAAPDHPEAGRGVEERRAPAHSHGFLAGVDQVGVRAVLRRIWAHAEDPALRLEHRPAEFIPVAERSDLICDATSS
jgi:hypothetical protein